MQSFFEKIRVLQHDDHRYYHQCRINQSLHLLSAISFLVAYAMLFIEPAAAGLVGWLVGMVTRQSGHIFFEPRGYDNVNGATDEYKESIKVGYNMRRKAVLISVWILLPILLLLTPSFFGLIKPAVGLKSWIHDVGLMWLALGGAGLAFRTVHLFFIRGVTWGFAWACKILLDPFHNVALYWKSPLALIQGQRYDPISNVTQR